MPSATRRPTLDDYVEAFEAAHAAGEPVTLGPAFLPPREDPLYPAVLRELVRVDLELSRRQGRPRRLGDYRGEFPALFTDRDALLDVTFEEFRLRRQAGEAVTPSEYRAEFGVNPADWPAPPSSARATRLPPGPPPPTDAPGLTPGATFAGFQLVAELGRGSFARVFLARQGELARRPVVLKVATAGPEPQRLAQLQHTNIVPVYSVHREGPWQAVCMPYFGASTLHDLLRHWRRRGILPGAAWPGAETVARSHAPSTRVPTVRPTSVSTPEPEDQPTPPSKAGHPSRPSCASPPSSPTASLTRTTAASSTATSSPPTYCSPTTAGPCSSISTWPRKSIHARRRRAAPCRTWPPSNWKPSLASWADPIAAATSSPWA